MFFPLKESICSNKYESFYSIYVKVEIIILQKLRNRSNTNKILDGKGWQRFSNSIFFFLILSLLKKRL
mgnify:CR=1 FL=1